MVVEVEDLILTELAKLLIETENLEGGELWEDYEELYTQDIQPKDKTQSPSETKYRFVEIMLKETK